MLRRRITDPDTPFERRPGWACVSRYGGIGDVIQVTSVFPRLKSEGLKLAVNCEDRGYEILKHDPHVDEFWTQAPGMVPDDRLDDYWARMSAAFDRFAQLTLTIEGVLLWGPAHPEYFTSTKAERHARCNRNYLEHIHEVAGVSGPFEPRFYPSAKERKWAEREALKMGRQIVVLSLSGSSVHKVYPWWDQVIQRLLRALPAATIVTVGDSLCRVLEAGWGKERRVKCRSGKWSVRETLAFCEEADVVVGTETGVLNAVGNRPVQKVLMLSHSSKENLSKHWVNTRVLTPWQAPCHPCHMLHHHSSTCSLVPSPREGDGQIPHCVAVIEPKDIVSPVLEAVEEREAA